jgi:O-antigen ligase
MFMLATLVAAATIAQSILGDSVRFLAGRLEAARVEGDVLLTESIRVIPPGQSIMMVAFIAIFTILVLRPARPSDALKFFQCGLIGLGIVVTFFRASWSVIALTVLLIGFLANGPERRRLVLWAIAAVLSVTVILLAVMEQPQSHGAILVRAALARASTLVNSGTYKDPSSSLRLRDYEYSYALPKILARPILGWGLGVSYRPLTSEDWPGYDGRRFIHNGHVYILLTTGVVGYGALLVFLLSILIRGLRNWRRIPDAYMRGRTLAFALMSLAVMIVSIVEPYVAESAWPPLIGIFAGINEVTMRKAHQPTSSHLS